ncbi:TrkH family potassium uptake protein [Breoghania sp. L-A4]|uniref:TrkH family potassium uptake protein n=1 Tax=Breoghania sp. L-A4 TaxID=2304600 RepID=UPI000E35D72A|nr:TrkH family potassium uptake protein [Breoghania sp. L-A4]AXS39576.1 TrkH family potassium uptake protein [Breoghania sp. L-A4]
MLAGSVPAPAWFTGCRASRRASDAFPPWKDWTISARLNLVIFPIGWLLIVIALSEMALGAISAMFLDGEAVTLMVASAGTFLFGLGIITTTAPEEFGMDFRQATLFVVLAWIALPVVATLPLVLPPMNMPFADALFETVSAITTTGSTVLSGLDELPQTILLWRSLLQWIGGIGIIGMALVIFPFLRIGGMQLFRLESSDQSEKLFYRSGQLAGAIMVVYGLITLACILAYRFGGMSWFDAINHALTTVCTGGFSTHDASMGYFDSAVINWTAVVFMTASGIPFLTYLRLARGHHRLGRRANWLETQVFAFLAFITSATLGIAWWLTVFDHVPFGKALGQVAFHVVSTVTTTGFAVTDYLAWGTPVAGMFFLLTFVGGCTGSTAGGIKIFRFQLLARMIGQHLSQQAYPHAIVTPRYGARKLSDEEIASIASFIFLYFLTWLGVALLLQMTGIDPMTALSGSITALANVGPGIGNVIGPAGNFASLPELAKYILAAAMIIGRLEIMTVFVLLIPAFYR